MTSVVQVVRAQAPCVLPAGEAICYFFKVLRLCAAVVYVFALGYVLYFVGSCLLSA